MEAATQAPEGVRPADKVLQALATLAALIDSTIREVKSLDNEFQSRLLQAVHDTEASLQVQSADHVARARQELREELQATFQNDLRAAIDGLKAEFEIERGQFTKELGNAVDAGAKLKSEMSELIAEVEQMKRDSAAELEKVGENAKKAVQDTEASLQAQAAEFEIERGRFTKELGDAVDAGAKLKSEMSELIAEVEQMKHDSAAELEKARENLTKAVQDTEATLQAQAVENIERARQEVQDELNGKYRKDLQAAAADLKAEFESECERLNKELLHTVEAASKLEAERSGLIAEVQKVKSDSLVEIEKAREEAAASKQAAPGATAPPAFLQEEIARTEAKLQEIFKLIDNPTTELSTVIRKNVEKSELEAYLRGIRLVLDSKS